MQNLYFCGVILRTTDVVQITSNIKLLQTLLIQSKLKQEFISPFSYKYVADTFSEFKLQSHSTFQASMQVQRKFTCFKIHLIVEKLQQEVINLQFKDKLKGKYQDNLVEFYKFLSSNKYAQLKPCVYAFISLFVTTYLGDKTYSKK